MSPSFSSHEEEFEKISVLNKRDYRFPVEIKWGKWGLYLFPAEKRTCPYFYENIEEKFR